MLLWSYFDYFITVFLYPWPFLMLREQKKLCFKQKLSFTLKQAVDVKSIFSEAVSMRKKSPPSKVTLSNPQNFPGGRRIVRHYINSNKTNEELKLNARDLE